MPEQKTLVLQDSVAANAYRTLNSPFITSPYWTYAFGMTWEARARFRLGYRWFVGPAADNPVALKPSGDEIFPGNTNIPEWFGQGQTIIVPHMQRITQVPSCVKMLAHSTLGVTAIAEGFVTVIID